jgi:hypothetical protein
MHRFCNYKIHSTFIQEWTKIGGNRPQERQLQGGGGRTGCKLHGRLQSQTLKQEEIMTTGATHRSCRSSSRANQGCSNDHTTVPPSAMWIHDHSGDPRHPKTTTTPFELWLLRSIQNKKNN